MGCDAPQAQWDARTGAGHAASLVVPAWLIYPRALAAVALASATELAGGSPTMTATWRDLLAEPGTWARVVASGALSIAAAALIRCTASGYLLAAVWLTSGVAVPAATSLGAWARRAACHRLSISNEHSSN